MEQALTHLNQSRIARLRAARDWALRYNVPALLFAAAGLAFGATLAAVLPVAFLVVLATASATETVTVSAWRPPPPPAPGLFDVNLTARLLPVPRALRREGHGD